MPVSTVVKSLEPTVLPFVVSVAVLPDIFAWVRVTSVVIFVVNMIVIMMFSVRGNVMPWMCFCCHWC